MRRPLPPFRVRPLRPAIIRKSIDAELAKELADEHTVSIKGVRRPLKLARTAPAYRLRVLGCGANGHAKAFSGIFH